MGVLLKRFSSRYHYHIIGAILFTMLFVCLDNGIISLSVKQQLQEYTVLNSTYINFFKSAIVYVLISSYIVEYFLKDNILSIMPVKKDDILKASYMIILSYIIFLIITNGIFVTIMAVIKGINNVSFIGNLINSFKRFSLMSIIILSLIPFQIHWEINRKFINGLYFFIVFTLENVLLWCFYEDIKYGLTLNGYSVGLFLGVLVLGIISYKVSKKIFNRCSVIK